MCPRKSEVLVKRVSSIPDVARPVSVLKRARTEVVGNTKPLNIVELVAVKLLVKPKTLEDGGLLLAAGTGNVMVAAPVEDPFEVKA